MEHILEAKKLEVHLGGQQVIDSLDLTIQKNDFLTILGPSGSGKSTLLNCMANIVKPSGGSLSYKSKQLKARMMFQEYGLFPWRTALQNIILGMNELGISDEEKTKLAHHWLSWVGLNQDANKYPKELSGGMKQRVALAQCLVSGAEVILMDEPFGALDSQMREVLQDLVLKHWRQEGGTIIFVTHNIREAIYLGNRLLIVGNKMVPVAEFDTPVTNDRMDPKVLEQEKEVRKIIKNMSRS